MNRLRRIGRPNIKIVQDKEDRPGADAVQQEAEPSAPEAGLAERGTPTETPLAEHANGLADAQTAPLVPGAEARLAEVAPAPEPEPIAGDVTQAEPVEQLEQAEQEQEQEQEQAEQEQAEPVASGRPTVVLEQPDTVAGEAEMPAAAPEVVAQEGAGPGPVADLDAADTDEPADTREAVAEVEVEVEPQTAPLPLEALEREDLTPLPVNAVVAGKYVVGSQLHHGMDRNLYRVAPRRQQKCETCGRLSPVDSSTCEHCGAALTNHAPADFYLMAESFRPDALMQDAGLMDLRLYHPNLVPVVDFFNYTPFGRARYYAVAEPRQGVRLSQMSMPRPAAQVFGWALQLADALDYLHNRGVVGAGAEADDILVQGDMASLASLQNARIAQEDSPERTQLQSMDLAKLASTIYEAYTGHPAAMSPEGVLPMPSQAPERVGAVFRSAIEPVQGIAPPISAAQWRDQVSAALMAITELEQPGRPVDFVTSSMTDVGRLRDQNQDSYAMSEVVQSSVESPMRLALYVVADGMGGHKGGEIASALAAQSFVSEVMARVMSPLASVVGERPALTNEAILQGMSRAVQTANDRIYKARDSRQNDMGTTLVAALIAGGKAYIINVGDSRLYLYTQRERKPEPGSPPTNVDATSPLNLKEGTAPLKKDTALLDEGRVASGKSKKETALLDEGKVSGKSKKQTTLLDEGRAPREPEPEEVPDRQGEYTLIQVSVDHSLVHRLVELGQLDPEEAKVHPHRNFIYRSLGGPPPIDVDTFVRTLHPGDRLLLCSDGLNSMIEDEQIEAVLDSEQNPEAACKRLIELANEAGGHDNITTLLVDITRYLPLPEHPEALDDA